MGMLPKPRQPPMGMQQPRPRQPPMGTQPRLRQPPIGMLPRPRPRPGQPYGQAGKGKGHVAKAKDALHGQRANREGEGWPGG